MGTVAERSQKALAIFVHGFGSSPRCWDDLLALLRADTRVSAAFDLMCFEYGTQWMNFNPRRRISDMNECAESLGAFLKTPDVACYRSIVLVGHSQGGLVIQQYLAGKTARGEAAELARIRQVILIATPNFGSAFLSLWRKLVSYFHENPQERRLRLFVPDIRAMHTQIHEQIEAAPGKGPHMWPIPFQAFWGAQDGIVNEASARGLFRSDAVFPLEGDHTSVIRPPSPDHENYKRIVDALLEPVGHSAVHEIDLFEMSLRVEPIGRQMIGASYGDQQRTIATDNRAEVIRRITFSRKNRCQKLFFLRYKTKNDGWLLPTMSHRNEAPPEEVAEYFDRGTKTVFGFTPKPGQTFQLKVDVYKGFDEGHRDLHFHLGPDRYYKRFRVRLDLTAYVADRWTMKRRPTLFLHEHDPEDHRLCAKRELRTPLDYSKEDGLGVWEWDLRDLGDGVLDLVWDVAAPMTKTEERARRVARRLPDAFPLTTIPSVHARGRRVAYGSIA